jgi:hypothetical protein
MKRIALCLSGQPRTWDKCHPSWVKIIDRLNDIFDAETDIFFHAWDFNSIPRKVIYQAMDKKSQDTGVNFSDVCELTDSYKTIDEEEKQNLIAIFKPKDFVFENREVNISREKQILENEKNRIHVPHYGEPIVWWAGSQFYSVMRSAHLKKKYEYKNHFKYDICIRGRFDFFLEDPNLLNKITIELPKYNHLYSCHTGKIDQFPFRRLGDIFWYSESLTFDRICDFYRWFPILGKRSFLHNDAILIEQVFYFYAKMLLINVHNIKGIDPKIYRHDMLLEFKKKYGLDLQKESYEF